MRRSLYPSCFSPLRERRFGLLVRRIRPSEPGAALHALEDERFHLLLLLGLLRNLVGEMLRNDHDTFFVADDDVTGIDRDAAAADRHVLVERVMVQQVERRAAARA